MKNLLPGLPSRFCIRVGVGHGETELLAFDSALVAAGISHYNLVKVSSIIPPGAALVEKIDLPPGSLLPIAYASLAVDQRDLVISAAVAAGIPASPDDVGVIMEFSGPVPLEEAECRVRFMAERALSSRGIRIKDIMVKGVSAEIKAEFNGIASVFAGVALL